MPEFNYSDCTEEEQKNAGLVYKTIDDLRRFENKASLALFKYLFKERGEHLFIEVFVRKSNRNILTFFNKTSIDIHQIIILNVLYNTTLYSHDFLYEE